MTERLFSDRQQGTLGSSLREFLYVFFKHQTKILTIFVVTIITVAVVTFLVAPVYEATASLLVKIGREYRIEPEVGNAQSPLSVNQEEIINSEIEILNNQELIEKVILAIGVGVLYPKLGASPLPGMTPFDAAVLKFSEALKVEGIKSSSVIRVSFQHQDPVIAAKALALLIDLFKEKHLEIFSNPQSSFLEKQLTDYKQRLKESESALEAFKQQNQVYSIEQQRSLLLKQQIELDTTLKKTRNSVEELKKKLAAYRAELGKVRTGSPVYQDIEKEVLKSEAELASQQAGAPMLAEQLAQLDNKIQSLDKKQNALRNLQRNLDINEKNYLAYVAKHEEARISDDLNRQKIANISVIQAPATPRIPVKPRKLLNLIVGVLLGAISSLGFAFFAEFASQSFSTPDQVERRLRLPVLTSIALKRT